MIKSINIYDIDGVLVNSEHRYRTVIKPCGKIAIDLQYWRDNEHLVHLDIPLPLMEKYKKDLNHKTKRVIIATAREAKQPDFDFVQKIGNPHCFVYRKKGDREKGSILKVKGIMDYLQGIKLAKNHVIRVYEDNHEYLKGICDNLKDHGFNTVGYYIPSNQGY